MKTYRSILMERGIQCGHSVYGWSFLNDDNNYRELPP